MNTFWKIILSNNLQSEVSLSGRSLSYSFSLSFPHGTLSAYFRQL